MYEPIFLFGGRKLTGFDWDEANREKCQKHGVSIGTIEAAFASPFFVLEDPTHSGREERFKAVLRDPDGRGILIAFTMRERGGEPLIRPISARYMHRKEMAHYEKAAEAAADAPKRQGR